MAISESLNEKGCVYSNSYSVQSDAMLSSEHRFLSVIRSPGKETGGK